jgi:hypothetical protein
MTLQLLYSWSLAIVGNTPRTGIIPIPTYRTTQTQNTNTNMHASSKIRTHDLSV